MLLKEYFAKLTLTELFCYDTREVSSREVSKRNGALKLYILIALLLIGV